jgi:hypothetical protein
MKAYFMYSFSCYSLLLSAEGVLSISDRNEEKRLVVILLGPLGYKLFNTEWNSNFQKIIALFMMLIAVCG